MLANKKLCTRKLTPLKFRVSSSDNFNAISKRSTTQLKLQRNFIKDSKESVKSKEKKVYVEEKDEITNLSNENISVLFNENLISVNDSEECFNLIENSQDTFLLEYVQKDDSEKIFDSKDLISCKESLTKLKPLKNFKKKCIKKGCVPCIANKRAPLEKKSNCTKNAYSKVKNRKFYSSKVEATETSTVLWRKNSEALMPLAQIDDCMELIRMDHNYSLPTQNQRSISMNSVNIQSNENLVTNQTSMEATEEINEATSAILTDFAKTEQQNHIHFLNEEENSTINKENCLKATNNKSENSIERKEGKKKMPPNFNTITKPTLLKTPSNVSDQFFAELINIIETILRRTSTVLYSKDLQNINMYEYICRKTDMLMKKNLKNKFNSILQGSNDYFPANEQSTPFFINFFQLNEYFLWTKVSKFCLICKICGNTVKYKTSLFDHLNVHYEHYHICKICTRKHASKRALAKHNRACHNIVEK